MKYTEMKNNEAASRKAAQRRQYLKRKAAGTQKKATISGSQCASQKWRNSKEYRAWRKEILKAGFCDECGSKKNLVAHHILSAKEYPGLRTDPKNGQCICTECHDKKHVTQD